MTVSRQRCVWAPRKSPGRRRSRYCGAQNVRIRDGDAGVWMRRVTTFSSCVQLRPICKLPRVEDTRIGINSGSSERSPQDGSTDVILPYADVAADGLSTAKELTS